MTEDEIRKAIAEERNAYFRAWRKKHPDKVKQYQDRYWLRKAKESGTAQGGENRNAEDSDKS